MCFSVLGTICREYSFCRQHGLLQTSPDHVHSQLDASFIGSPLRTWAGNLHCTMDDYGGLHSGFPMLCA